MCTVSMVYDHFRPRFEPYFVPFPQPIFTPLTLDDPQLQKMIDAFKKALVAAKEVDRLTAQPDCEDPEKAKLEERVAVLQRLLADREIEISRLKGETT